MNADTRVASVHAHLYDALLWSGKDPDNLSDCTTLAAYCDLMTVLEAVAPYRKRDDDAN